MASETDVNEGRQPVDAASQEATNPAEQATDAGQASAGQKGKRRRPPRRQYHGPKRRLKKPIELRSQVAQDVVTGFRYSQDEQEYQSIDYLARVAAACQQLDSRLPTIAGDNKTIKKIERALWAKFNEAQAEMSAARAAVEEQLLTNGADPEEEVQTMMDYEGEAYVIDGYYVTPGHRRFLVFLGQLDELIRLLDAAWFEELMTNEEHTEKMLYWRKRGREVSRSIAQHARDANRARRNPNPADEVASDEGEAQPDTGKADTAEPDTTTSDQTKDAAAEPKETGKPKGQTQAKGQPKTKAAKETAEAADEAADEQ